ncbi:hypothetical protein [Aquimarina rubra]|uniref:Uncharacterized protein n=1 Tax=Aquimarina rubra TaxID=1920033 RepID=A0ABW5LAZ5_9FLAO
MEVLGHLIFMLFKIGILASIYSLILIAIMTMINNLKKNHYLQKIIDNKKSSWFRFGLIISALLLIYSFTYWGNHGLGDGPRIPIGYWNIVDNTNWQFSNLKGYKDKDANEISISRFLTKDEFFCGKFDQNHFFYDFKNEYFVLNMRSNEIIEFSNKQVYNYYAVENKLPKASSLLTFEQNYHKYFGGWRFWLLP